MTLGWGRLTGIPGILWQTPHNFTQGLTNTSQTLMGSSLSTLPSRKGFLTPRLYLKYATLFLLTFGEKS